MGKKILFQGDSITDAGRRSTFDSCGYPLLGLGCGYPLLIASRLWAEQPERGWELINRAVSGNRIVDLYARWKADAVNLAPDVLSILIGVNDTWHEFASRNGVEVPRYEEFYRRLLDWSLEKNPRLKLILLEPFVLPFGAVAESWLPEIEARRDAVRRIAADYGAALVTLQERFTAAARRAPGSHWLVDGVHPTPAGHWLIAEAWLEAARPLLA